MKLSDLKHDPKRLEEGAWVDEIPEMQGLRLKVRGANNRDWRKLQQKLLEAVPRARRVGGRIDPDESDAITSKCLINCGLLDWDGLTDENDQPLPYSKEMATKLLTDPEFRKFREAAVWACSVVAEQADLNVKDDAGN